MKFMGELLIDSTLWKIIRKKRIRHPDHPGQNLRGLCDSIGETMSIVTGIGDLEELATLVHEVLHALSYEYDFDLSHAEIEKLEMPIAKLIYDNFMA